MSCDPGESTQVLVWFEVDQALWANVAEVEVSVGDLEPVTASALEVEASEDNQGGDPDFVRFLQPVRPLNDDASRRFRVRARLLDADGVAVGSRLAIGRFTEDSRREVLLRFDMSCPLSCVNCVPGQCVPSCVEPVAEATTPTPSVACGNGMRTLSTRWDGPSLTDFPLLVSLSGFMDLAQSDASDLQFALDGELLSHDIESYDATSGELVVWVLVPRLSPDTQLEMFFGREGVPQYGENVWRDYRAVFHFQSPEVSDSTGGASPPRMSGTFELESPGRIGQGFSASTPNMLNFGTDYYEVADGSSVTLSTWFRLEVPLAGNQPILTKGGGVAGGAGYQLAVLDSGEPFRLRAQVGATDGNNVSAFTRSVEPQEWTHALMVIDAAASSLELFVNGESVDRATSDGFALNDDTALTVGIGSEQFLGQLDEFRFRDAAVDADWARASFENQSDPAMFIVVGEPQMLP